MRPKNIHGGGSKTNENGLQFERDTDLITALGKVDYLKVKGSSIFYGDKEVASVSKQRRFYSEFLNPLLSPLDIDGEKILSKNLLPDSALANHHSKEVFIIENKYQKTADSVDEKLQTCDFKLKQYQKLLQKTEYKAHFIFLLSDWFKKSEYRDVKEYIESVGCQYFLRELPLTAIKMDEDSLKSNPT